MQLYEEFPDRRDDFEILAFHDNKAKDLADLDAKLEPVIERVWGGKTLPFPILMDATGQTLRTFGIRAFPTVVAIDPEGNVVRGGEHTLRDYLMVTDPETKKLMAALQKDFASGVAAAQGNRGAYALGQFAETATPAQLVVVGDAMRRLGGPYAVGYFFERLGAGEKEARVTAAEALGEIGDRTALGGLVQFYNKEPDADVKQALADALQKIQTK